jgi:hypothetical protein
MTGDRAAFDAAVARILADVLVAEVRAEDEGTPVQSEGPRDPARASATPTAGDESHRELSTTLQVKA